MARRVIWFITKFITARSTIASVLEIKNMCSNMSSGSYINHITNVYPEICSTANKISETSAFIEACREVADNTFTCIDVSCFDLFMILINSWGGIAMVIAFMMCMTWYFVSFAERKITRYKRKPVYAYDFVYPEVHSIESQRRHGIEVPLHSLLNGKQVTLKQE